MTGSPYLSMRERLATACCLARNTYVADERGGPDPDDHWADVILGAIPDLAALLPAPIPQGEDGWLDAVQAHLTTVHDAINEPPRRWDIEPMDIRDYRHDLWRSFEPLMNDVLHLIAIARAAGGGYE